MSKLRIVATLGLGILGFAPLAQAQQSLFGQPTTPPAPLTEPTPAPAAAAAPKPRRKPRGPVPARSVTVTNDSTGTITDLEVSAEGKSAKMGKPLGPKQKATLRLPAFKSCTVTVSTSFEGSPDADTASQDVCKDKNIRFTE